MHVFRSADEMREVWLAHGGEPEGMPDVDFDRHMIVALFADEGSYREIRIITRVLQGDGKLWIMVGKASRPWAMINPYTLLDVPRTEGEPVFLDLASTEAQEILHRVDGAGAAAIQPVSKGVYRTAASRPVALSEPVERPQAIEQVREPTPYDLDEIARIQRRDRNRIFGMGVLVVMMIRTFPHVPATSPLAIMLLWLAPTALGVYALWSWARPRGFGPALLRFHPEGEITAGRRFTVEAVLSPLHAMTNQPLKVRLVAFASNERGPEELLLVSERVLAEDHPIIADRPMRLATEMQIPEDIHARARRVRFRVEVTVGDPASVWIARPLRVSPPIRRRRRRAGAA
ncbi:Hypothetical protein A7982_11936 [Minicystis rosea]|nr:Hypothetical protein A7982_11936 [Minicystis rosea]